VQRLAVVDQQHRSVDASAPARRASGHEVRDPVQHEQRDHHSSQQHDREVASGQRLLDRLADDEEQQQVGHRRIGQAALAREPESQQQGDIDGKTLQDVIHAR
jgi:hypothetical protein